MNDELYIMGTAALIVGSIVIGMLRKSFDPFAPVWMFLAGYFQIYVVQATSNREWAIDARGADVVSQANLRALWALAWFLLVYHCGLGKLVAARLPRPPERWSLPLIGVTTPLLLVWGFACSVLVYMGRTDVSAEETLLFAFPFFMIIAAVLMIVTSRHLPTPSPMLTALGVATAGLYAVIWMFNGKRSHPLFGILSALCAYYISRGTRPSKLVLAATGVACALSVTVAINWRNNPKYERSVSGFIDYLGDFDPALMLRDMNLAAGHDEVVQSAALASKETEEYGGFLLMLDTVPAKSEYDYGESYMRIISTYIPRLVWPDKPVFGRQHWISAWMAGSQFVRKSDFTGPSIGILGAAQLNGGAVGTFVLMAALALLIRTAYDHFRMYASTPWIQVWWPLTFYNAWLMTVNDDPFVWFYYIYGHSMLPVLAFFWIVHKFAGTGVAERGAAVIYQPAVQG